jgi:hypothetical protein|tara:strand:- start:2464 stop:2655 length:192 start_codon:yes stop_codon:yes gene_type:complete
MIYKATAKFKDLDTSNAYHGLSRDQYYQLMNGESVKLKNEPKALLRGDFVELAKQVKVKVKEK